MVQAKGRSLGGPHSPSKSADHLLLQRKTPGDQRLLAEVPGPLEGGASDQRRLETGEAGDLVDLVEEAGVVLVGAVEGRDRRRLVPELDGVAAEGVTFVRAAAILARLGVGLAAS